MRNKDIFTVAIRNLSAGKSMVWKMIFSMSLIVMIVISFVVIVDSYDCYKDDFNRNHLADCYFYSDFSDSSLADMAEIYAQSSARRQQYHATDSLVLASVKWNDDSILFANDTTITVDGTEYTASYKFSYRNEYYQDITSRTSEISLGLYERGTLLFTERMAGIYEDPYMIGNYPDNPGEIILDTHVLSVFGIKNIDESIIGSKISIYRNVEGTKIPFVQNYILSGVFEDEMLAVRESLYSSDPHIEHIYVNFREEDKAGFKVRSGTVRYYFQNYSDYSKNCEYLDSILHLYLDEIFSEQNGDVKLTPKGLEYCLIYWLIDNVGKLLIFVSVAIGAIVAFSLLYVFQFYYDRNAYYIKMLYNIGMAKKDRISIFTVEMSIISVTATVVGMYFSALFLILLNMIMKSMFAFPISFHIGVCCLAIGLSWLFFTFFFILSARKSECLHE